MNFKWKVLKFFLIVLYVLYFVMLFKIVTCKTLSIRFPKGEPIYWVNYDVSGTINYIKQNRELGYWNYNLIPFRAYYDWFTHGIWDALIRNLLGNIVAFVPMGFFEMALSKHRKFWKVVLKCFIIVTCLELFQFITCLGYLDIDDITMNTFGCLLGCLCFSLLAYICHKAKNFFTKN